MRWYSTIAMFSASFALLVPILLYILRSFGHVIRIRHISLRSFQNISYSSQKRSLAIKSIYIKFHRPRRLSPYWAIITTDHFDYEDEECHVTLQRLEAKLWMFPVFFRFTAGPWIDTTLDGLTIHVHSSNISPWWVSAIRNNLMSTILIGETIRLHNLTTKIHLNPSSNQPMAYCSDSEDEPSDDKDETMDHVDDEEGNNDQLRIRGTASQWQILSPWNSRIYSFDHLEAVLHRSWVEETGSFSMIAKNCRWTKVPAYSTMDVYHQSSELWQIFRAVYRFPLNLVRIYYDPMSTLNVSVPQCDITFANFRLRDAELLEQGALKLKQDYYDFKIRHPGIMQEIAWDIFFNGVPSLFHR